MIAAGLGNKTSQSSILIQVGNKLEEFWNGVISKCTKNLIEVTNRIEVKDSNRQLDHLFEGLENTYLFYLESKCNLNFDTEKKPASNTKVKEVTEAISQKYQKPVLNGYFVPCIRDVPEEVKKKYPNVNIYGVEWLMKTINCNLFTVDEFFVFFEEVVGPILEEKMYD
jgi:hypothetical protein